MKIRVCDFFAIVFLETVIFGVQSSVIAGNSEKKDMLVSNADYTFMPVLTLDARLADEHGAVVAKIHAKIDRKRQRVHVFRVVVGGKTFRLGEHIRQVESVYGPIDLASLRMFRVRGEYQTRSEPVRYRIEFGFRKQYEDFVYSLPSQHSLPQCSIEIFNGRAQRLECFNHGAGGRIVARPFELR